MMLAVNGTRIELKAKRKIWSIACLRRKLYAITLWSKKLQVFNCEPPFTQLEDITVEVMKTPWDIAACNATGRLFISENQNKCFVIVDPENLQQAKKIVTRSYAPHTLSVSSGRLLVTARDGKKIYIYNTAGDIADFDKPLQTGEMPDKVKVRHAVEIQEGTGFACVEVESGERQSDVEYRICKFDVDVEKVKCHYRENQTIILNKPLHVVLGQDDRVIVADSDNNRVVLFDSDLKFVTVLVENLGDERDSLYTLCYLPEGNQLIAGNAKSGSFVYYLQRRHVESKDERVPAKKSV
jgi:hypothetical protein